jgi:hypothetical protein
MGQIHREEAGLPQDAVQMGYFNIQSVFYSSSQSDRFSVYTQLIGRRKERSSKQTST